MNKLTNVNVVVCRPRHNGSLIANNVPLRQESGPAAHVCHGLVCRWTKDPESSRLVCSWSDPSNPEDQPVSWRGFGRADAAMRLAA